MPLGTLLVLVIFLTLNQQKDQNQFFYKLQGTKPNKKSVGLIPKSDENAGAKHTFKPILYYIHTYIYLVKNIYIYIHTHLSKIYIHTHAIQINAK